MKYTIRLPANRVLQDKIGHLLTRPVGRPPNEVRRFPASFSYQAQCWKKPRRVVAFYNQRGTCEQRIKEGKGAIDVPAVGSTSDFPVFPYRLC